MLSPFFSFLRPRHRADLVFWTAALLLNAGLFLPLYLFFRSEAVFWPQPESWAEWLQRENADLFRLHVEWILLLTAYVCLRRARPMLRILIPAVYLLQILYATYEGFIRAYYYLPPNAYDDFVLFQNGWSFTLNSLQLSTGTTTAGGGLLLAAGAVIGGLLWVVMDNTRVERLRPGSRIGLLTLSASLLLGTAVLRTQTADPHTAVSSLTAKLVDNIALSHEAYTQVRHFDRLPLEDHYPFTATPLTYQPNIYLIFIESYGSVLFKRPDFANEYDLLTAELDEQFQEAGWQVASARSQAPTWGGGSWMSYTSALAGLRIDSHGQYRRFLNRYDERPFPHLFNYLRDQGYRSYRLSGMASEIDEAEWQQYQRFYGIDQWWRLQDLNYAGPLYGWGPSLPDQYALHYAHHQMAEAQTPTVFFYISQNSHYPWAALPRLVPDWQTLNMMPPPIEPGPVSHAQLRYQYMASIEYELRTLAHFITTEGDENDLFVLIGDHQPARVSRQDDGWDTPIHIISRDGRVLDPFTAVGFVPGLNTAVHDPIMRHEGFYTLFVRALLQRQGLPIDELPPYLPDGVSLE